MAQPQDAEPSKKRAWEPGDEKDFNFVRFRCKIPGEWERGGECVAYAIYAARDLDRYTRAPGRTRAGFASNRRQFAAEELSVKLIMADVKRRMYQAGQPDRATRLQAGEIPEGQDFQHFAGHVGGRLVVVPLERPGEQARSGGASPATFGDGNIKLVLGMLARGGVLHLELIETHMQGERSQAWPVRALAIKQPLAGRIAGGALPTASQIGPMRTPFHGSFALVDAGTSELLARAWISDSIPVDEDEVAQLAEQNLLTPGTMSQYMRGRPLHAWVLEHVVPEQPPYLTLPPGLCAGQWALVTLPDAAEDAEEKGARLFARNQRRAVAREEGRAVRTVSSPGTEEDRGGASGGVSVPDPLLQRVVKKCKGGEFTAKHVWNSIKHCKYTRASKRPGMEVVEDVINSLIDGGLAEAAGDGKTRKGPRVRRCRWKPWADIQGDPGCADIRARLGLIEGDFE